MEKPEWTFWPTQYNDGYMSLYYVFIQTHKMYKTKSEKVNYRLQIIRLSVWVSQVVLVVKNPPANAGDARDMGSIPG